MRSYAENAARALHETVRGLKEPEAEKAVKRLVEALAAKGRLALVPRVIEAYGRVAREAEGGFTARVTAARPVPPEVQDRLAEALAVRTGRPVESQAATDPGLIAGAVVRHGDTLLDDTVKRKLELLKLSMIS